MMRQPSRFAALLLLSTLLSACYVAPGSPNYKPPTAPGPTIAPTTAPSAAIYMAYVLSAASNSVIAYSLNPATGTLTQVGRSRHAAGSRRPNSTAFALPSGCNPTYLTVSGYQMFVLCNSTPPYLVALTIASDGSISGTQTPTATLDTGASNMKSAYVGNANIGQVTIIAVANNVMPEIQLVTSSGDGLSTPAKYGLRTYAGAMALSLASSSVLQVYVALYDLASGDVVSGPTDNISGFQVSPALQFQGFVNALTAGSYDTNTLLYGAGANVNVLGVANSSGMVTFTAFPNPYTLTAPGPAHDNLITFSADPVSPVLAIAASSGLSIYDVSGNAKSETTLPNPPVAISSIDTPSGVYVGVLDASNLTLYSIAPTTYSITPYSPQPGSGTSALFLAALNQSM